MTWKSLITIKKEEGMSIHLKDFEKTDAPMAREVALCHPGEILLEDWLKPLGISQYRLAKAIGVPPRRINAIVHGQRGITPDTALRLAAFFGTDAQSWLNLQSHYDMELARQSLLPALATITRYDAVPA
jgi:addiction module HigA family antidote